MAPSAITPDVVPTVTGTGKSRLTKADHGYLDTSNDVVADYTTTEIRGNAEILTAASTKTYGDWRDDFFKKGYHVAKGAIPRERAESYRQRMLDWFANIASSVPSVSDKAFSYDDRSTWTQAHLPMMMKGGMIINYCAAHEAWAWELRSEPGVIEPFAQLWGDSELLVSFDAPNVTLPGRTDVPWSPWPHVDQSPTRKGLACVQGIINLSPAGPKDGGLLLYQGSSALFDQFFAENPPRAKVEGQPGQVDFYAFTEQDVEWFKQRGGCKLVKICAEPGDVIIWDSRTVHYAALPESDIIRTIQYATYAPRKLATETDLALKAELFRKHEASTHWPHCNIWGNGKAMRDGRICPAERDEPIEKPEITDTVLKLAGLKEY
ncbi:hypothetical protein B0H66DRAFT_559888 [Apodospora peruviana]|uniref:Phytanoyl-CoA dioxygenase n=1 Tax=Apodospora peruviana TaxID=516989 RepID=A0AAE0I057_9PEZI|nr:hypothetical protein B0H66DRAFT_559888 [Apodospora peruviana]